VGGASETYTYANLQAALKGTGLQAHHILPQRFAALFEQNVREMLAVALTKAEHDAFTLAWRHLIPYGTGTGAATQQQVLDAARQIYKMYPDLLGALGL